MKSIYRSVEARQQVLALYDRQLERLSVPYQDLYVKTTFGRTHLIETGNMAGIPLLVFHGGNATTAYNLLACGFLLPHFHIYAVDTIGHPGKSAEVSLSSRGYAYGKWAGEVIGLLGFDKMRCFGGSFGAGILAKAMCAVPDKIEKAVLYVPSGIRNAPAIHSVSMLLPMAAYWVTHKEKWLKKAVLPMGVVPDNIDPDILETSKCSIDNVRIKTGMPSDVRLEDMKRCDAPALVMAAELDCLFPAGRVLPRAKEAISACTTYLLQNRGHMHRLTEDETAMIVDFLLK